MADDTTAMPATRLLEVRGLKKQYPVGAHPFSTARRWVRAIDDVDLHLDRGETLGLVGESGSGKTTLGKCIIRALTPTAGEVLFRLPEGIVVDLAKATKRQLRQWRRHLHMVFQDPHSSLNPRMTVLDIVAEPLICNRLVRKGEVVERVRHLLEIVGLDPRHMVRYPHAFSGGQRQRIGIARSLAAQPQLIVCDEPVSALDVSVQAQVLNLLQELQSRYGLTYLFVAHDLAVVEHMADRVAVMYAGRIVETAPTRPLYARPRHPYTEALLSAVPRADEDASGRRIILPGDPADPSKLPSGCPFHPRCAHANEQCRIERPPLEEVEPGHAAACHRAGGLYLRGVA